MRSARLAIPLTLLLLVGQGFTAVPRAAERQRGIQTIHAAGNAKRVKIGVLSIFHPTEITLFTNLGSELIVRTDDQTIFLAPREKLEVRVSDTFLFLTYNNRHSRTAAFKATSRNNGPVDFALAIRSKITRHYRGTLEISVVDGALQPVISMELETAVASIVAAESLPGTPAEALKSQAIVSRSYLVASKSRHANFDSCDLTHCQFLREPPAVGSPAYEATESTRGLVLTFDERPVATMFTRSCSGHTQTPASIGLPGSEYHYVSVLCEFCYNHPVRWMRKLSPDDAALLTDHTEAARLDIDRRLGWNAIPSDTFAARLSDNDVLLEGTGQGHGVGLCQRGASAMARQGRSFTEILAHYFPDTTLVPYPALPASTTKRLVD